MDSDRKCAVLCGIEESEKYAISLAKRKFYILIMIIKFAKQHI